MLSKTRFQYAMICRKRAWLDAHRRELARPPDAALRLRLADGHRVGRIARERWAGGVLVTEPSARHARAAARTSLLLEDASVGAIFEGAFAHDGLRIRADVLARGESAFELIEVKSAARRRDEHLLDLAIQAYVIDGCGVDLESASLLHMNPGYVWQGGAYDPNAMFVRVDSTSEVFDLLPTVREHTREFRAMLAETSAPEIEMGPQCRRHDVCPFMAFCRREAGMPAPTVPDLTDLAVRMPPSGDGSPLSFLDIQTFSTALPRLDGTSPHEQIPFLWSLRVVRADGTSEDRHELSPFGADSRASFAETLAAALPAHGQIVFFSDVAPRAMEMLAACRPAAAERCARRLASDGVDILSHLVGGPPNDAGAGTWEALAPVAGASGSAKTFASHREAAAAYVEAIDRATPQAHRDAIADALTRYGRANLAALAGLLRVARVAPRV